MTAVESICQVESGITPEFNNCIPAYKYFLTYKTYGINTYPEFGLNTNISSLSNFLRPGTRSLTGSRNFYLQE